MYTLALIIFAVVVYIFRKKVDRYDYLTVLRTTEWKSGQTIRKEVMRTFRVWISLGNVYIAMRHLEAEGLAERRELKKKERPVREFRLTPGGLHHKNKQSIHPYQGTGQQATC